MTRKVCNTLKEKTCINYCIYFIRLFDLSTPSLATLLGKCDNKNCDHYQHMLGLKHPMYPKYKLGE